MRNYPTLRLEVLMDLLPGLTHGVVQKELGTTEVQEDGSEVNIPLGLIILVVSNKLTDLCLDSSQTSRQIISLKTKPLKAHSIRPYSC